MLCSLSARGRILPGDTLAISMYVCGVFPDFECFPSLLTFTMSFLRIHSYIDINSTSPRRVGVKSINSNEFTMFV